MITLRLSKLITTRICNRQRCFLLQTFCSSKRKTVLTHDGVFHADDAMACCLLTCFTPEFEHAQVVRSRKEKDINAAEVVVDVGGVYDPSNYRYDHHQRGFSLTFSDKHTIKLSASGLVYLHHGRDCLLQAVRSLADRGELPKAIKMESVAAQMDGLFSSVYDSLFLTLDAIDNGVDLVDSSITKRYEPYKTDLAHRVSRLNPPWWNPWTPEEALKKFKMAIDLCKEEFLQEVLSTVMATVGSESVVMRSFATGVREQGRILILEQSCSWKSALPLVEDKLGITGRTQFVVFPDLQSTGYRVQGVPLSKGSFGCRSLLAKGWRGLQGAQLAEQSGIPDAVFVHHSGFIGGSLSQESAVRMATLSLGQ